MSDDDAHVRTRGKDPLFLRDILFENIGLERSTQLRARNSLLLGSGDVLRQCDAGGAVDRHRGRDIAHVDAVEEHLHIGERIDRDAALSHLAARLRRIGVVTHQRRHIEGDREAVLAVLEQKVIALVGLGGRTESGKLTHRPEAVSIAVGMDAARVRELARPREIFGEVEARDILRSVDDFQRNVGDRAVDGSRARILSRPPFCRRRFPSPSLLLECRSRLGAQPTGLIQNCHPE